jgi:hypothetical protein
MDEAEAMVKALIEISLRPGIDLRKLAANALADSPDPAPIMTVSVVCRADLDRVAQTMA